MNTFLLLFCVLFIVALVRSFISSGKLYKIFSCNHQIPGNFLAAALGILAPLGSCTVMPLFWGLIKLDVPVGATFSFIIASSMVNGVVIVLLAGLLGWKIALIYGVGGYAIAVVAGFVLGKLNGEDFVEPGIVYREDVFPDGIMMSWTERLQSALHFTLEILIRTWPFFLLALGVGVIMYQYLPLEFVIQHIAGRPWCTALLAAAVGLPFYSSAADTMPPVCFLVEKGVSAGAGLAFMMAVLGLSIPGLLALRMVMKTKLIVIFAAIMSTGILLAGCLFNYLLS